MKIAVSASGQDLDAQIDQRFGRCEYFLIVEADTMETQAFPNDNRNQTSGAGVQAAGFVINKGAQAVLTGSCGPKAMDVFNAQDIPVHTGHAGSIRQAVEAFKRGKPETSGSSTAGRNTPARHPVREPAEVDVGWAAVAVRGWAAAEAVAVDAAGAWAAADAAGETGEFRCPQPVFH